MRPTPLHRLTTARIKFTLHVWTMFPLRTIEVRILASIYMVAILTLIVCIILTTYVNVPGAPILGGIVIVASLILSRVRVSKRERARIVERLLSQEISPELLVNGLAGKFIVGGVGVYTKRTYHTITVFVMGSCLAILVGLLFLAAN